MAPIVVAIAMIASSARAQDAPIPFGTARLLLAFAPSAGDPALQQQRALVDRARSDMTERQLVLVPVVGPNDLRRRYRVATTGFEAVLVGKDGGAKLRSPTPIPVETLIATIDAMPMRRQEMQR